MTELVDDLLRYGLFVGAIFQLVCIAAVIFIPPKDENKDGNDSSDEDNSENVIHTPHKHGGHRRNKQEKKKRR